MSKLIKGVNDLATVKSDLVKEWHPTKNGNLKPTEITYKSKKKVWWKCSKGHEWETAIINRSNGSGCPYCSNMKVLRGYNDLATLRPALVKEWHPIKNGDLKPTDVTCGSGKKVWWIDKFGHEWEAFICSRAGNKHQGCPVCSGRVALAGCNDLESQFPEIAKEWDYELNNGITPSQVAAHSNKKYYWKCSKGHSYESFVSNRVSNGSGCPYCAGKAVLRGFNDLATFKPDLVKEWHATKNGDLKPTDVTCGSNKKVWWKCSEGHEWKVAISHRNDGHGCPYCSNQKVIQGYNDLATVRPDLAKEWHPTRNGDLKPTDVTHGGRKKVWWYLSHDVPDDYPVEHLRGEHFDFEWEAVISSRNVGVDCPFLTGQAVWQGFNDLATVNPDLAKEWHPTRNGDLKPTDVTYRSGKKVWWYLSYDVPDDYPVEHLRGNHFDLEWQSAVSHRSDGIGCPFLSGHVVYEGFNDLTTVNPELAKEWHPTRNGDLKPTDVTYKNNKKVWWKCSKGHEWKAVIGHRSSGNGCPYCAGKAVWQGFNDLATVNPELAKEWHPTRNGDLKPTDVTYGSGKKVWWKCSKGHEWNTPVGSRNGKLRYSKCTGCPVCKESRLEKLVRDYLTRSDYIFSEQIRFEDLLGTGSRQLSYDFAVYMNGQLYALIECQGIQHYKPVEFFGGKERFKIQKIHDKLKREYAANTLNVLLIEIPYHVTEQEALEMLKFS